MTPNTREERNECRCPQCVLENNNGICDRKDCCNYNNPDELVNTRERTEKAIEQVLLNRIKLIGDEDQLYTGYPAQLIEELASAFHQELQKAREKSRKKKIKKPNMKKPKKPWPECLSKKELLEQYQVTENDLDILDNEMYELRRECDRRNIDPYK